ncbi:MAG: calcium-translocating P-type ATPase, PMCA-type [Bacilli bacterium]|nr:calcium-translocating P-type ATPase, PMCA-type [Bacilli bacterium]
MDIKNGLTDKEVLESRNKYGKNTISSKKNEGFFKLFLESLGDPIIRILLIALGIKIVFLIQDFDWYETVGIVIAIFIASFISTISEYGSEKAFTKLQEESSKLKCKVLRNNKIKLIDINDVVVGDIIILETGDKVPADGVIVKGTVNVDESSLNGEPREIKKIETTNIQSTETKNNVFRGTVIYSGEAKMYVTKVGNKTFYGEMALELQEKQPESPLKIRLRGLANTISKLGYIGALLVSFSYLFSVIVINNNFNIQNIIETLTNFRVMFGHILYALTLSVTVIVVAVPEGLPMMITLVLSSNMKRMVKNNVCVRKMVGIETAGSINILFTDKTGTLTKGKLEVVGFMDANQRYYNNESDLSKSSKLYNMVGLSCIYNNSSSYSEGKIIGGNITDRAVLGFMHNFNNHDYKKIDSTPFDSKLKYSSSVISNGLNKIHLFKGAPEIILSHCDRYYTDTGSVRGLYDKKKINDIIKYKTSNGIRVLALAYGNEKQLSNLILIGLLFIKDDVRKDSIKGIELVHKAHIQTVMITGDNKDTATSIGKEVGIIKDDNDLIITSTELNNMTDDEVKKIIPKLRIVARSLPKDKSRLVRLSQEIGLVVGMTGDGVNDAPALKRADVGFAMGSGTEVSKEASDIIIMDDNFLSISKAILFGRTIFKSIRKFIIFQLTVNICAVSLSIIGPFIGIEAPVTVIQMLWINMVMDTLAGLAFAFEPPLLEYMDEYPKKKDESIINDYMKNEIIITGIYSSILCLLFLKLPIISRIFRDSTNNEYLMSAFFGLFIFIGIFNSFNARTSRINIFANILKNKVFLSVIIFITIVQIILIYFGGNLFRTIGLNFKEFNLMMILAMTVIPFDWLRKYLLKRRKVNYGV